MLQPIRALGVTVYNREGNLFSIYSISDYSCLSLVTFGYGCLIMAFSAPMQSTDNKNAQTIESLIKNPLEYIYNLYHDHCSENNNIALKCVRIWHISLRYTYINVTRKFLSFCGPHIFVHSKLFMIPHIVYTICFPSSRIRTCILQNIYCQFQQITLKIAIYRIYMSMTALQLGIGGQTIGSGLKCHHFSGFLQFGQLSKTRGYKCSGHIMQ